ncbi:MAG TPA: PDZ domain-containing protein, partial [Thermoguttaceae bacterium]|nr:PDZ domain-containing protein [Thermoguttaceae bacterium]
NTAEPVVAACHPGSPAAKALKPGDRITAVDGAPIRRVVEFEDALGRHYAGDRITLQVERDGKTREKQVTLVAELPSLIKPAALEKRDP